MNKVSTSELLFYQKLGELFYAVAASDKIVREAEYAALSKLVEEKWKRMDEYHDLFGSDAAYQIAIVFEWFDYEQMDADDCFSSFRDYYISHKNIFDEKRKDLILQTTHEIAASFAGTNKSELIMIAKLELLFKNH